MKKCDATHRFYGILIKCQLNHWHEGNHSVNESEIMASWKQDSWCDADNFCTLPLYHSGIHADGSLYEWTSRMPRCPAVLRYDSGSKPDDKVYQCIYNLGHKGDKEMMHVIKPTDITKISWPIGPVCISTSCRLEANHGGNHANCQKEWKPLSFTLCAEPHASGLTCFLPIGHGETHMFSWTTKPMTAEEELVEYVNSYLVSQHGKPLTNHIINKVITAIKESKI